MQQIYQSDIIDLEYIKYFMLEIEFTIPAQDMYSNEAKRTN